MLTKWPENNLKSRAHWPPRHTGSCDLMHLTIGISALRAPPEGIADERNQPGESVAGIGIVLDDVEGEPPIIGLVRRQ